MTYWHLQYPLLSSLWLNGVYIIADYSPFLAKQVKGFDSLYSDMEKGPYIWLFLAIVVVGPIIEEILFRGIIFSSFENATRSSWFPVIITGVMFGIWHGSFIQGVYTAIFGMILAYFMKKCRSLVFVAFAHGINNLSGTLPPSLDTDFTNTLLNVTSYVCILPTLAILYHLHRKSKKITNQYDTFRDLLSLIHGVKQFKNHLFIRKKRLPKFMANAFIGCNIC